MTNEERREATRRAVLDAAATCFDATGYLATSLDDLTARASLTKGAVYFHFGSKEALAASFIREQEQYWPSLIAEITGRPGSALDHVVAASYEVNRVLRDNIGIRVGFNLSFDRDVPSVNPADTYVMWTNRVADILRRARRAGVLAEGITPTRAARVIVAGFLGARHLAVVVDGQPDARKRLDEFWALLLGQLTAKP